MKIPHIELNNNGDEYECTYDELCLLQVRYRNYESNKAHFDSVLIYSKIVNDKSPSQVVKIIEGVIKKHKKM